MKDSAATGIKTAQQTGKLRKEAAMQGNKAKVGKRDGASMGGSSGPSSSGLSTVSPGSGSQSKSITTRSSSDISNAGARNASRRMQNKQNVDKAIAVAEKIPVANKYAKMAKKIREVQKKVQGVSGAIKSKMNEGTDVSKDDVEEANRAEQAGEEYKPDAAEARYTAITSRQMKYTVIFILGGIFVGSIFFCIILLSAITDSGGHAYLASKENPSEEDLEKEYSANEEEDRGQDDEDNSDSSDSSSDSSSGSSSQSTSSNTPPVAVPTTGNKNIDKITSIAVKEAKSASPASKFRDWFPASGDWCGMFVSWVFSQAGGLDKYYVKSAQAGPGARDSVSRGYGSWVEDECTDSKSVPKPGDVLHYRPVPKNSPHYVDKMSSGHVGYVYAVDNNNIYTVEGNNDPNKVVFVTRSRKDCVINGYYRPKY